MGGYKIAENNRKSKQFMMTVLFLFILLSSWVYPLLGLAIPLCMLAGIGAGFFKGRKWCDWFCPRGSFFDFVIYPLSPKKEIPRCLKNVRFRIALLVILLLLLAIQLRRLGPDFTKIGFFFAVLLSAATALGIILGLIFHPRCWCSFCPVGTITNLIASPRGRLRIDSRLCVECKQCHKICPIQIDPLKFKQEGIKPVKDGDCLRCGLCVAVCPVKALSFSEKKE